MASRPVAAYSITDVIVLGVAGVWLHEPTRARREIRAKVL